MNSERIRVGKGSSGQLWVKKGENQTEVKLVRCFPWTEPGRWISLRDEKEAEVALVQDVRALPEGEREILEEALAEAGFVIEIRSVLAHEEDFELRNWKVKTAQGPRTFQTRLDEWPRGVPGGGLLIRDVNGDLYLIPEAESLDPLSRKLLWAFID